MVRCRALALLLFLVAGSVAAAWLAGPLLHPSPLTVAAGLTAALAWALVACWAWLALTTALLALETAATGQATRTDRLAPRLARVLVATACGVSLTVAVGGSGSAQPLGGGTGQVRLLDGLALPERVADPPQRTGAAGVVITVRHGDTLWDLARAHGIAWRLLYRVNRTVIGADPDLIRVGQRLVVPTSTSAPRSAPISEGAERR